MTPNIAWTTRSPSSLVLAWAWGPQLRRSVPVMARKWSCADINDGSGEETVESIRAAGGDGACCAVRCRRGRAGQGAGRADGRHFGRLDCAVNNAAITPDVLPIAEADMAVWDRVIRIDLRSVMLCMKYQISQFLAQGPAGAIVNVGSVSSASGRSPPIPPMSRPSMG